MRAPFVKRIYCEVSATFARNANNGSLQRSIAPERASNLHTIITEAIMSTCRRGISFQPSLDTHDLFVQGSTVDV